jgi:hypothetical protein
LTSAHAATAMRETSINKFSRFSLTRQRAFAGDFEFRSLQTTFVIGCDRSVFKLNRKFSFSIDGCDYQLIGGLSWPYKISLKFQGKMVLELQTTSSSAWRTWVSPSGEFCNTRSNVDCGGNFRRFDLYFQKKRVATWFRGDFLKTDVVARLGSDSDLLAIVVSIVVASLVRWDSAMS